MPFYSRLLFFVLILLSSITITASPSFFFVQSVSDSALTKKDSLTTTQKKKGAVIDTTVIYSANDSMMFSFKNKKMDMYGNSKIKYGSLNLDAGHVNINWNENLLFAEGVLDSSNKINELPKFVDEGEGYDGFHVYYNFKTKKGRVTQALTEMGDGYYRGSTIKKQDVDVLYVSDGIFTSCNKPEPHFHIWGKEMKIIVHDKIIARPVVLKIANIPVFALPFAVLPNQSGRQSGIIPPTYGDSQLRGIFLRGGGYYWAINDYTDLTTTTDLYSRGGYTLESLFNYYVLDSYRGRLDLGFARDIAGEPTDFDYSQRDDYRISLSHNQEFSPTLSLNGSLNFISSNFYKRTSFNPNDLLNQTIESNASLSKEFEETPYSMNIGFSRRQDIRTGSVSQTFPTISLNRRQTNPFKSETSTVSNQAWYERITLGYSAYFTNINNRYRTSDTASFVYTDNYGLKQTPSISIPFPVAKYFTFSPSFNYNEYWYPKTVRKTYNPTTKQIESKTVNGFASARDYSVGTSLSTTLYGIVQPRIGKINGFRHVLRPSLSYMYRPDFGDKDFGYYKTVTDSLGRATKYSIFEGSVIGAPGSGKVSALGINLSNTFEMKMDGDVDENGKTGADKVIPLIRQLGLSTSYNFAADSLNWSNLSLNASTNIGDGFSISYSSSFSFYDVDPITQRNLTRHTLFDHGKGLARRLNQSLSFGFSFSGEKKENKERTYYENRNLDNPYYQTANPIDIQRQKLKSIDFDIPYSATISASFSENTPNPVTKNQYASANYSFDLSLTQNWKVSGYGGYDFIQNQFSTPNFVLSRDLHCWQMDFSWVPSGLYSYYSLNIHVKAPQLNDISYKKNDNYGGF